jgi:hypothetical protein
MVNEEQEKISKIRQSLMIGMQSGSTSYSKLMFSRVYLKTINFETLDLFILAYDKAMEEEKLLFNKKVRKDNMFIFSCMGLLALWVLFIFFFV